MEELEDSKERLLEWLVSRQLMEVNGFQGRINKVPDTWYSFWNTASLAILDPNYPKEFVHKESIEEFIDSCRRYGGFAKLTHSSYPDILHTYYSLAFLSLMDNEGFNKLDPVLAIPQTSFLSSV